MNELKEIYDIELSAEEKKRIIISYLIGRHIEIKRALELTSDSASRIKTLELLEAIKYVVEKLEEEE